MPSLGVELEAVPGSDPAALPLFPLCRLPGPEPMWANLGGTQRNGPAPSDVALGIVTEERVMNNIIYIVGLVVVVMAVLAFFGLR